MSDQCIVFQRSSIQTWELFGLEIQLWRSLEVWKIKFLIKKNEQTSFLRIGNLLLGNYQNVTKQQIFYFFLVSKNLKCLTFFSALILKLQLYFKTQKTHVFYLKVSSICLKNNRLGKSVLCLKYVLSLWYLLHLKIDDGRKWGRKLELKIHRAIICPQVLEKGAVHIQPN